MNTAIFNFIHGASGASGLLDACGVLVAEYVPYLMVAGVLVFLAGRQGRRARLFFLIEAALAVILSRGIVTEFIRFFYHHPRPFDALHFAPLISESGFSFPSGHASAYFALAAVIYLYNRNWGIWYCLGAALNGVARVYVGVHWPLDVVGGAAVGIASAFFIRWLLASYRQKLLAVPETATSVSP